MPEYVGMQRMQLGRRRVVQSRGAQDPRAPRPDRGGRATRRRQQSRQQTRPRIGATIGIIGAGFAGVFDGRVVGDRLPERAIAIGSSMLFAVFGVARIALNL